MASGPYMSAWYTHLSNTPFGKGRQKGSAGYAKGTGKGSRVTLRSEKNQRISDRLEFLSNL